MAVIVWGSSVDAGPVAVHTALERRGVRSLFVDQLRILETELELEVGAAVHGTLQLGDQVVDLQRVNACYVRPSALNLIPNLADAGADAASWRHALAVNEVLRTWTEVTDALVVNRLSAMESNWSKPYQLQRIAEFGFATPHTLVTTDPEAALAFWERHRAVIYKSVSGIRSRVCQLRAEHLERLPNIRNCPTQFQQYVPGPDYRVHVVGDRLFASEIVCQADDYRYTKQLPVRIDDCVIPVEIAAQCVALSAELGLLVSGIDLRRTPAGEWYCFEVNPSPAFWCYQSSSGDAVGDAIAALLASAEPGGRVALERVPPASEASP